MLIFPKKILTQYIHLISFIIISGLLLFFSNSVLVDILAFVILVIGALVIVRFDVSHPYVWFSTIFMLYSISYPILFLSGFTYDVYTYTKSLIFSEWLALTTFLLIVTPSKVDYSHLNKNKKEVISSKILVYSVSIFVLITIFEVLSGGYSNKGEIYGGGSIIVFIGFRAALILLMVYAINLSIFALNRKKIDVKLSLYVFIVIFLLSFFSGERDLLIRFFVILSFVYYILVQNSKITKEVIWFGAIGLLSIPLLNIFKYYGLTGEIRSSQENFLIQFLTSDFMSASKNLQILLLDETSEGLFNGSSFLSAILRSLNLDKLPWFEITSSGQWFNEHYFGPNRAGQGFTLVGDGYVNFGYFGIVLLFIFIGLLIKLLYVNSNRGIHFFVYYILAIPVFMYTIRADLANILVPLVKQNLVFIILIIVLVKLLNNTQSKSSSKLNITSNK